MSFESRPSIYHGMGYHLNLNQFVLSLLRDKLSGVQLKFTSRAPTILGERFNDGHGCGQASRISRTTDI